MDYRSMRAGAAPVYLAFWMTCPLAAQISVLTANYGNERTNANLQETALNTSNVNAASFGKLYSVPVDGQIYAQPLLVSGVAVSGISRDVVYVATMNNSVYAIDANAPTGRGLWRVNLGPPVSSTVFNLTDITPQIGILSTPVIDPTRNAIYVVAETYEQGTTVFRLHALDLASGAEILGGPAKIAASVPGGSGPTGSIAFNGFLHLQRPGLLLLNNTIYIGFGSHADQQPYHGWIIAYDASNVQNEIAAFNATPQGSAGSVWQSGRGLAADSDGSVYAATANGDYDGIANFSQSFVKLRPDLSILDWFAPADWQELSDQDFDVGTLGPVVVPGTNYVLGGDKIGNLYLLDTGHMGGLGITGQRNPETLLAAPGGGVFNVAVWQRGANSVVYLARVGAWSEALSIANGQIYPTPVTQGPVTSDRPFQGMAISANGSSADSGILWMTTGDHTTAGIPGTLHALSAIDLSTELWNSDMNSSRDRLGTFAKFANPTVANGRVYVPTFSNELVIYGLLNHTPDTLNGNPARDGRRR